MNDPVPLIQDAFDSGTIENCLGWISHSGYMYLDMASIHKLYISMNAYL